MKIKIIFGVFLLVLGAGIPSTLLAVPSAEGEESSNNLSYPAVYTAGLTDEFGSSFPLGGGELGTHFTYACDIPEVVDIFSYPNTSCITDLGGAMTPEECTAEGAVCAGKDLSRVYWQKVEGNSWTADNILHDLPVESNYLDWGDNLESKTWTTRSVIRVETQPFHDTGEILTGFQMWHVSGHGITELWGIRTTDSETPIPYAYESPYAIVHTTKARISFTKLEARKTDLCPSAGVGGGENPPSLALDWVVDVENPSEMKWVSADGSADPDPCKLKDDDYTVELNVGGKYVYGYNWATKRDVLPQECADFNKAGWWRLTFYTEGDVVFFNPDSPVVEPFGPPPLPVPEPIILSVESETEETIYTPVVDYEHNITYIDICLLEKEQGGGGGGNGNGGN